MSVITVGRCPVCFALTYLSLVEPHATRNDVEWRTFACSKCGPVKAVLMPIKGYRPEIRVPPSNQRAKLKHAHNLRSTPPVKAALHR